VDDAERAMFLASWDPMLLDQTQGAAVATPRRDRERPPPLSGLSADGPQVGTWVGWAMGCWD
jgi:hypothetical protein